MLKPDFVYDDFQKWRNPMFHLAVEIGCGVGFHPISWAKAHPDKQILAIERTSEKFARFQSRLIRHQLPNLFAAHADATYLLPHLLEAASADEVFVLYPNPYPKAKHKNQRLAHSALLKEISRILKPGQPLHLATNIQEYADECAKALPTTQTFTICRYEQLSPTHTPRTHFEKKYLQRGDKCFDLDFRRV